MIVAQSKNCRSAVIGLEVSQDCLVFVLLFFSNPQRSLSPGMSTASTAVKVKSRMTEMTSSQPILLS